MPDVLRTGDIDVQDLDELFNQYHLKIQLVDIDTAIPGSFWGDEEAGLIHNQLYLRADTPIHSALHESCHYICMDQQRRQQLHTNAGGNSNEENAVCYLQILLADRLPWMGQKRMFSDMDSWGYSFRLGNTRDWFESDAEESREFLLNHKLMDDLGEPVFVLRA